MDEDSILPERAVQGGEFAVFRLHRPRHQMRFDQIFVITHCRSQVGEYHALSRKFIRQLVLHDLAIDKYQQTALFIAGKGSRFFAGTAAVAAPFARIKRSASSQRICR